MSYTADELLWCVDVLELEPSSYWHQGQARAIAARLIAGDY